MGDVKPAPPAWIFGLLVIPGAVYRHGIGTTAVSSLLRSEGMKVGDIAHVVGLLVVPAMLYFLWSPLVDFWLRRRTWAAVTSMAAGALLGAAMQLPRLGGVWPGTLLTLGMCVVMMGTAALGGLMAEVLPAEGKTRASGFYQGGNLGWGALAGGGILYLSQQLGRREFGIVCGLMVALPGLLALTVAEPEVGGRGETFGEELGRIGREFRHTFLKWDALPVLLILMAPFGSGAAIGMLPGLAPDYGISVNQVAWMNGPAAGLLMALGAVLAGLLKLPEDLRAVYTSASLVNALTLGIMLLGPPRPATYFVSVTLYMISVGACYALVVALALQLLGLSGKSGGSRYAIALSLANLPVWYMVEVDGLGARWFGVKGLPGIDMSVSIVTAVGFLGWFWWERKRGVKVVLGLTAEEV